MSEKRIHEIPIHKLVSSTPSTPLSGYWKIYPKSDGWYILDSNGIETKLDTASVTGTTNFISKFINSSSIGNSLLSDDGTNVTLTSGIFIIPSLRVTTSPVSGYVLTSDGSGNATWQANSGTGSGTTNVMTKWTSSTTIGNSSVNDNGTLVSTNSTFSIGSTVSSQWTTFAPNTKLFVGGNFFLAQSDITVEGNINVGQPLIPTSTSGLVLWNGTNGSIKITGSSAVASITYTFPNNVPGSTQALMVNTSGTMSYQTVIGGTIVNNQIAVGNGSNILHGFTGFTYSSSFGTTTFTSDNLLSTFKNGTGVRSGYLGDFLGTLNSTYFAMDDVAKTLVLNAPTGALQINLPSNGSGKILTSDGVGGATWQTPAATFNLPIVRYVYLVQDSSDATRMSGVSNNVYTSFQTAHDAAHALQITNGGIVVIEVENTTAASVGNLVLSSSNTTLTGFTWKNAVGGNIAGGQTIVGATSGATGTVTSNFSNRIQFTQTSVIQFISGETVNTTSGPVRSVQVVIPFQPAFNQSIKFAGLGSSISNLGSITATNSVGNGYTVAFSADGVTIGTINASGTGGGYGGNISIFGGNSDVVLSPITSNGSSGSVTGSLYLDQNAIIGAFLPGQTITGSLSGATATLTQLQAPFYEFVPISGTFIQNDIITNGLGASGRVTNISTGSAGSINVTTSIGYGISVSDCNLIGVGSGQGGSSQISNAELTGTITSTGGLTGGASGLIRINNCIGTGTNIVVTKYGDFQTFSATNEGIQIVDSFINNITQINNSTFDYGINQYSAFTSVITNSEIKGSYIRTAASSGGWAGCALKNVIFTNTQGITTLNFSATTQSACNGLFVNSMSNQFFTMEDCKFDTSPISVIHNGISNSAVYTNGTGGAFTVGQTVTGSTSLKIAKVISITDFNGRGSFVFSETSGNFTDGETITASGGKSVIYHQNAVAYTAANSGSFATVGHTIVGALSNKTVVVATLSTFGSSGVFTYTPTSGKFIVTEQLNDTTNSSHATCNGVVTTFTLESGTFFYTGRSGSPTNTQFAVGATITGNNSGNTAIITNVINTAANPITGATGQLTFGSATGSFATDTSVTSIGPLGTTSATISVGTLGYGRIGNLTANDTVFGGNITINYSSQVLSPSTTIWQKNRINGTATITATGVNLINKYNFIDCTIFGTAPTYNLNTYTVFTHGNITYVLQQGNINYNTLTGGNFTAGDTITGGTSGTTAIVVTDDGSSILTFGNVVGSGFVNGETITDGGVSAVISTTTPITNIFTLGNTITGSLSGATAKVATDNTTTNLTYGALVSTFSTLETITDGIATALILTDTYVGQLNVDYNASLFGKALLSNTNSLSILSLTTGSTLGLIEYQPISNGQTIIFTGTPISSISLGQIALETSTPLTLTGRTTANDFLILRNDNGYFRQTDASILA